MLQLKNGQKSTSQILPKGEEKKQPADSGQTCANSGWSEKRIAYALASSYFKNRSILFLPNCIWTGSESDLLVVELSKKLIDVEIKISRADFKADAKKQKWWRYLTPAEKLAQGREDEHFAQERTDWPGGVWKHIYVMPKAIWKDDLLQHMASDKSGVVLIDEIDGRMVFKDLKKPEKTKMLSFCRTGRFLTLHGWPTSVCGKPTGILKNPGIGGFE